MDMGRGNNRVRCMESNIETYITICQIDSQQEFAVYTRFMSVLFIDVTQESRHTAMLDT